MSTPVNVESPSTSPASREPVRIVLKEITGNLNNSPPSQVRSKSGNDSKSTDHKVEVKFNREFVDVPVQNPVSEGVSAASSVHSLTDSHSYESSRAISPDSLSGSPDKTSNVSYLNSDINGLDDLISKCANIRLETTFNESFASANDESLVIIPGSAWENIPQNNANDTQVIPALDATLVINPSSPFASLQDSKNDSLENSANATVVLGTSNSSNATNVIFETSSAGDDHPPAELKKGLEIIEDYGSFKADLLKFSTANEGIEDSTPQADVAAPLKNSPKTRKVSLARADTYVIPTEFEALPEAISVREPEEVTKTEVLEPAKVTEPVVQDSEDVSAGPDAVAETQGVSESAHEGSTKEGVNLNDTLPLESLANSADDSFEAAIKDLEDSLRDERVITSFEKLNDIANVDVNLPEVPEEPLKHFVPQRQSSELGFDTENLECMEVAAQAVADDILHSSQQNFHEAERFVSATDHLFNDPNTFDYFLKASNKNSRDNKRFESLYVKFDPLVSNVSMLPQSNNAAGTEGENEKNTSSVANFDTPKRNPAIEAIDKLLFYSPMATPSVEKAKGSLEIKETKEASATNNVLVLDEKTAKELEFVKSQVLQLEEDLEKQKILNREEREREKSERLGLMKERLDQERIHEDRLCQMQKKVDQEIDNNKKMSVVVDEYEKSISRLVAERETSRADAEREKEKLQEELQAANHHLSNTEAAFNDVHSKYERLKTAVQAYKSNETVLKESIQENEETINALEKRYEALKSHAMSQLAKANQELETIRKKHEAETVKLKAMVRKSELKSTTLSELVDQKVKENQELAKILDEMIGRVGDQNVD